MERGLPWTSALKERVPIRGVDSPGETAPPSFDWARFRCSYIRPVVFLNFWLMSLTSRRLHRVPKQKMWHSISDAAIRISFVLSFSKPQFFLCGLLKQTQD